MDLALSFLQSRQSQDGLWYDFRTLAGESADWVTGYVAAQLMRAGAATESLDCAAAALLARQHADGGWGYHRQVPSDADSTANVLLFLRAHCPHHPALEQAAAYVQACQFSNGGVATYAEPGPIRSYMQLPERFSIAGWCQPHVSVTAAAGLAWADLGGAWQDFAEGAWQYLLQNQHPDGYWASYWWTCPHYPTYLAVALVAALDPAYRRQPVVRRVTSWLQATQLSSGGWALQPGHAEADFATALAVATLALAEPGADPLRWGLARLQRRQQADGGWQCRPILSIPPPDIVEPGDVARWRIDALGTGVALCDQHRLFTSATCLLGLSLGTART